MASNPKLLWPDPLVLTPEILHGALADWGIPPSWGRLDASVWTRHYRLDERGEAVTRGGTPKPVPDPPPGYEPAVIDAAFWNRLKWGVCEAADRYAVRLLNGKDRHKLEITATPWDTGKRVKPTWAELRQIVVSWWLDAASARLLDGDRDGSIDHCVRWARDRAMGGLRLPFGVNAKPKSLVHLGNIRAKDGAFPKTTLLGADGARVEIASEADAQTLANAAIAQGNRLETARNILANDAREKVLKAADLTGGLGPAATDVARLNARTRAMNAAHELLGPGTIDAQFGRVLATV